MPESTNVIACTWFYIFLITPTPICPSAFLCPSWENKMVFLKGKFFPGGQEKERGTFLSPTSRSSRRSVTHRGHQPPHPYKRCQFRPTRAGCPFLPPTWFTLLWFQCSARSLGFSLDFGYRSRSFLLLDIALCGGVTSTIPCTARSGEQKFLLLRSLSACSFVPGNFYCYS